MHYVSCIDTFLSGWGKSKDRDNKLVFECETNEEVDKLVHILNKRSDFKYVYKYTDDFPKRLLKDKEVKTDNTYYQLKRASEWLNFKR
jgi:hypothetical protein